MFSLIHKLVGIFAAQQVVYKNNYIQLILAAELRVYVVLQEIYVFHQL